MIRVPGAKHELLSERDIFRQQFFAAFDAFIPGETLEDAVMQGETVLQEETEKASAA